MLKATLSVVLLTAAQNAIALNLQQERAARLSKQELKDLIKAELATGDYDVDNGQEQCVKKQVKKRLRQYFQREYKCNYKFDENGVKDPNPDRLARCLANQAAKLER